MSLPDGGESGKVQFCPLVGIHCPAARRTIARARLHRGCGRRMPMTPTTYILLDLPCTVLLEPMLHQAPPGATIVVYTAAMREPVEQAMRTAGRGERKQVAGERASETRP